MCFEGYRHFFGTSIVWEEAPGASVSKFSIPENSVPGELTAGEAEDYYKIGPFPETLGQCLLRTGLDTVCIYTDAVGSPVYDGTFVCVTGSGSGQTEFIALVEEFLARGR